MSEIKVVSIIIALFLGGCASVPRKINGRKLAPEVRAYLLAQPDREEIIRIMKMSNKEFGKWFMENR